MFEDILEEEKKTWENGWYYCPYIPMLVISWKESLKKELLEIEVEFME